MYVGAVPESDFIRLVRRLVAGIRAEWKSRCAATVIEATVVLTARHVLRFGSWRSLSDGPVVPQWRCHFFFDEKKNEQQKSLRAWASSVRRALVAKRMRRSRIPEPWEVSLLWLDV